MAAASDEGQMRCRFNDLDRNANRPRCFQRFFSAHRATVWMLGCEQEPAHEAADERQRDKRLMQENQSGVTYHRVVFA
jgi:hypothetical protein